MHLLVIPWDVNPEIFRIGAFAVRWYGLLFASSFLIGYFIMLRIFKNEPLKGDIFFVDVVKNVLRIFILIEIEIYIDNAKK